MRSYSLDLRQRVLADCDAGMETLEVAQQYDVSPAWVRRLKQRRRETGEIAARPRGGARRTIIDGPKLSKAVEQKPDATLAELRDHLALKCSISALCMALQRLKITLKKSEAGFGTGPSRRRAATGTVESLVAGRRSIQAGFHR